MHGCDRIYTKWVLKKGHKINYNFKTIITMRKLFLCAFAFLCFTANMTAQTAKDVRKERQEIRKTSKSDLNAKATKDARKDAKKLAKEGWITAPGALPLAKQLDKSYLMQMEYEEDMYPKYLMASAMSIGENYDAAKMQAIELAKLNLAGQIQTEVTALIENSVANQQLANEDASSITQSIMGAKNLISQSIGRTIPVMECYRVKPNNNKEVLVRIAYNGAMAKAAAKKAIQDELKGKSEDLQKKLDEILGW